MSTDSNSPAPASTAQATGSTQGSAPKTPQAPSASASGTTAAKVQPQPAATVAAAPQYKSEDYGGAQIVRLRLRQPDIIQYDAQYNLKLDSSDPKGVPMPLTPFFAARLNTTVELVSQ